MGHSSGIETVNSSAAWPASSLDGRASRSFRRKTAGGDDVAAALAADDARIVLPRVIGCDACLDDLARGKQGAGHLPQGEPAGMDCQSACDGADDRRQD
jgi:hypothetical protein